MYKIYDFRCTNGHVFEEMVESNVRPVGAVVARMLHVWYLPRPFTLMALMVHSPALI